MNLDEPIFLFVTGRDLAVAVITTMMLKALGLLASIPINALKDDPFGTIGKTLAVTAVGFLLGADDSSAPEEHRHLYMLISIAAGAGAVGIFWLSERLEKRMHDASKGTGDEIAKPAVEDGVTKGEMHREHGSDDDGEVDSQANK